jgi:thioredoxin-dependent peroxiredoxin
MNTAVSPRRTPRIGLALATLLSAFALIIMASTFALAEPPKVGDKAPDFEWTALDKGKVKLSALLKKGPVVLVLLRGYPGYQCPFCTKQVGSLMGKAGKFDDAKAQVVLVYPGPADGLKAHADEFIQGKDIPKNFRLVLDPDYDFTKKYDLRWDAPHETSYPSTFVIDEKGKILFAKVSHSHGDRATTEEILKALGQ